MDELDDLAQTIRLALEPLSPLHGWEFCAHCGATVGSGKAHACRTTNWDIPGFTHDAKRRAKSYAIE